MAKNKCTHIWLWNPENSRMHLNEYQEALNYDVDEDMEWEIDKAQHASKQDKFYIICHDGRGLNGICASGRIDYVINRKKKNQHASKFGLAFDAMLHPYKCPLLSIDILQKELPTIDWGGEPIIGKEEIISKLDSLWGEFLEEHKDLFHLEAFCIDSIRYSGELKRRERDDENVEDEEFISVGIDFDESRGKFSCAWDKQKVEADTLEEAKHKTLQALSDFKEDSIEFYFDEYNEYEDLFEKAINIACNIHKGQKDQQGLPYFTHLWRVMWQTGDDKEKVSSLLKDAHISERYLKEEGFTDDMIKTIVALNQNEGEPYEDYIKRLAENESAQYIKILELEDLLNLSLYSDLNDGDYPKINNYIWALNYLNTIFYED